MNCPPGFAYQTLKLLWFNFYVHFKQSLSVIWQDYTTSTFTTCINSYTNGVFFFKFLIFFYLFRKKSKRCLRTWCRSNTPTLLSSTSTGWTWKRPRLGWEVYCFSYFCHCLLLNTLFSANVFFPFPHVVCRSFLSLNTCLQGASSSSWRRQKRTTKPWMWRSGLSLLVTYSVVDLRWSRELQIHIS